jgi:hypothetical protein
MNLARQSRPIRAADEMGRENRFRARIRKRRATAYQHADHLAAWTLDAPETNRVRVHVVDGRNVAAVPELEHRVDDIAHRAVDSRTAE